MPADKKKMRSEWSEKKSCTTSKAQARSRARSHRDNGEDESDRFRCLCQWTRLNWLRWPKSMEFDEIWFVQKWCVRAMRTNARHRRFTWYARQPKREEKKTSIDYYDSFQSIYIVSSSFSGYSAGILATETQWMRAHHAELIRFTNAICLRIVIVNSIRCNLNKLPAAQQDIEQRYTE